MNFALPAQPAASASSGIHREAILPWLKHLGHLFPITHALVVGAGKGSSPWIRFLLKATKNPVTLVEADSSCFKHLRRFFIKQTSWLLLNKLIAPVKGPAIFHRFSLLGESGLMAPASLQELWPRLRLRESIPLEAITLDDALNSLPTPADWLFIDCFPSVTLLQNCNLRRSTIQVILARVTIGCDKTDFAGSSIETMVEALEEFGFQFLVFDPKHNPKTGYALFVRKPCPPPNHPLPATVAELNELWLQNLRTLSRSQLGQDLWALERCSYKRGGFFIEFGATDGISLSNTFLLEQQFGWNGICAEPNPKYFTELSRNRICKVACECIGSTTGEQVAFVFASEYGSMVRDMHKDSHWEKRKPYIDTNQTAVLCTISLHDFLIKHHAPRSIDYLSIDTEGSEFSILETFPFDYWDIRYITVEHNFTEQRQEIRNLLCSHGYRVQEAEWDDWYYREES